MIRPARVTDAEALGRLHVLSWQVGYATVFPAEFLDELDVAARVKWFHRIIGQGVSVQVAESGSDVVGFVTYGDSSDAGWGEIYAIYVHPDHWRSGHGRNLIERAERGLRDGGHLRALLWVLEPNVNARAFYERQGWVLVQPIRLEQIGGVDVTEVRYERDLQVGSSPARDLPGKSL